MDKKQRVSTIYEDLINRGIVKSKQEFAALVGVNYQNLSTAMNGNERFLTDKLVGRIVAKYNEIVKEADRPEPQDTSDYVLIPKDTAEMYKNMAATIKAQSDLIETLTDLVKTLTAGRK